MMFVSVSARPYRTSYATPTARGPEASTSSWSANSKSRTTGGYGVTIIDAIAERVTITTARESGTEVRMTFSLPGAPTR
ncbi:hypothetical protein BH20ACT13_BH20ACT13_15140 [soil metagenome]